LFFPSKNYINHPDHSEIAKSAIDAVTLATIDNLSYFKYRSILPSHHVKNIFIYSPHQSDYYFGISSTLEINISSLLKHKSQIKNINDVKEKIINSALWTGTNVVIVMLKVLK
jgi:LmbE family N-acetylglucosaminyl deacetylase